jgi:nuclear pore complex protein Nup107
VARLLLDMLPPELAAISTPEERAAEYLDYRQFFIAWETLERATECSELEAPQVSRDTRAAWIKDYGVRLPLLFSHSYARCSQRWIQGLVSSARDQIVKLLTTDWLVPEAEIPAGALLSTHFFFHSLDNALIADRRVRELARIRQVFVPELILRLHMLLVSSRTHIPECVLILSVCFPFVLTSPFLFISNVRYALYLANIVADSRYMLFTEFSGENGRRLKEYLAAVRAAVLAGLEHGGSDPFRVVL